MSGIIGGAGKSGIIGETHGGIKHASIWRLHTSHSGTTAALDPLSNLEKDDGTGAGSIGSDMVPASGIFTFPSTGIWDIHYFTSSYHDSAARYIDVIIYATVDNGATAYDDIAATTTHIGSDAGSNYVMTGATVRTIFKVHDTTLCKVKFYWNAITGAGNVHLRGNTTKNDTFIIFTRLGDI